MLEQAAKGGGGGGGGVLQRVKEKVEGVVEERLRLGSITDSNERNGREQSGTGLVVTT